MSTSGGQQGPGKPPFFPVDSPLIHQVFDGQVDGQKPARFIVDL
jgi:hypothetical protein